MARVWDPFLSESDQADMATRPPKKKRGFGASPALLLIDLYRGVFGDEPMPQAQGVKLWPSSCGLTAWNTLPAIRKLLATARAAGIPVIHTTGINEGREHQWGGPGQAPVNPEAAARDARGFDIIDEVAPLSGELVIRKASPSCFWGTPLVAYLNSLRVDTVIVGGESTSGCVRASVVEGSTYRYSMVVAEDCVFDRHEACHAINLFDMNQKYADVLPLSDVLTYVSSQGTGVSADRVGRARALSGVSR